jgi:hypothetical protein
VNLRRGPIWHLPDVTGAIRALGNAGARANACGAVERTASDRTAMDRIAERLSTSHPSSARSEEGSGRAHDS